MALNYKEGITNETTEEPMTQDKGHCKHGEFLLSEGCPQCIREARERRAGPGGPGANIYGPKPEHETQADRNDEIDRLAHYEKQREIEREATAKATAEPSADTALALRPGEDTEVHGYFLEAQKLQQYAESRVIATVEDAKLATDDLSIISRLKKAMEEKRKEYLAPLQDQVKAINETYKTLMEPILGADYVTRHKLLDYQKEQDRIRHEQEEINRKRQEAAAQEKALTGQVTEPVELVEVTPEASKRVSTEIGMAGQRANWKYEVFDFALLPNEYKLADSAMLNSIAKKYHDQKQIPGVRFYNDPTIQVTTR